jgi:2-phosphosulfolactate phosphatase
MQIAIESLDQGARRARGTAVVIDVFRAFTTAGVAIAGGAEKIVMVRDPHEALALREQGLGDAVMGEGGGLPVAVFEYGNSSYQLSRADVAGKTLMQRTSAGTQGVVAAAAVAERVFCGALERFRFRFVHIQRC